jgi:hypothetical protein
MSPVSLSNSPKSSSARLTAHDPSRFGGATKEDLHAYIQELLAKLEEQTVKIIQLEQVRVPL